MEWFNLFRQHVAKGEEVDLVSFNQDYDANICERIAARHGMTFSTDREHDTAFLRKPKDVAVTYSATLAKSSGPPEP